MATRPKPKEAGFPRIDYVEAELATRPMPLHELPRQVGIDTAMAVIARHHARIARAIEMFWGTRDCVEYIQKLVMNGGDGFGNARIGFKPEVVSALLSLSTMHRIER
ncbi:MAG: hypothetical protein LH632_07230 [Rhodoferax sp.]|nr:hypothetical protein [Rhodoferax sp.]